MPRKLTTRAARKMAAARTTKSGGRLGGTLGARKRGAQRCPCGAMTLKRATARGRTVLGHEASCAFSRKLTTRAARKMAAARKTHSGGKDGRPHMHFSKRRRRDVEARNKDWR